MVQVFKKTKGQAELPVRKEKLKAFLVEVRIKSEHRIGLLLSVGSLVLEGFICG